MTMRLLALDEGPDIPVDRSMVVVGRHPQCDARIDSIRVSRRHCCMTADQNEVVVRDLGSTNGIRINGQRVEMGRLKLGDELSIAHIRYRLDASPSPEHTLANSSHSHLVRATPLGAHEYEGMAVIPALDPAAETPRDEVIPADAEERLASAVRKLLPSELGERCRIQIVVQMQPATDRDEEPAEACPPDSFP